MNRFEIISRVKYEGRIIYIIRDVKNDLVTLVYRSTGHNSHTPGKIYPCAGVWASVSERDFNPLVKVEKYIEDTSYLPYGWIVKMGYIIDLKNKRIVLETALLRDRYDSLYRELFTSINNFLENKKEEDIKVKYDYVSTPINAKGVSVWIKEVFKKEVGNTKDYVKSIISTF
jgi:hypothetical protein